MFIEGSSPRQQGDRATLVSQEFRTSGSVCLAFWFHFYGTHIGNINVYTYTAGRRSRAILVLNRMYC